MIAEADTGRAAGKPPAHRDHGSRTSAARFPGWQLPV